MTEDEVEIEPDDDEYEVVPLSPIRKLEKRIDELEERKDVGGTKGLVLEVMDLIKANQRMVDEIVKSNNDLRRELEELPGKIDEVTEQWSEFLDILKRGEESQPESAVSEGISQDMKKLVELNKNLIEKNEEMVDSIVSLKESMRGKAGDGSSPKVRVKKNSRSPGRDQAGNRSERRDSRRGNPRVKIKDRNKNQME